MSLGDLCDITVGRTPARNNRAFWGPGEPWVSIADMNQGMVITDTKEQITSAAAKSGKLVRAGTVMLSFKLSIGKVGIAGRDLYTNEAIAALPIKNPDQLLPKYLVRALQVADLSGGANRAAMGATLNKAKLQQFQIPVPPLDEQRRIAAILDQANGVRVKRREVLRRIDALPGANFLERFGDPVDNPRGWRRLPLGDLISGIASGQSPVCESRKAGADEWGILKLGAVSYGTFMPGENKAFLGDLATVRRVEVRPGDFLFSRKNTKELVGATVVVPEGVPPRLLLPDLIFRLDLKKGEIEPEYLHGLLRSSSKRPQVVALASGSASSMSNISQARLMGLTVEVPPVEEQREYAGYVRAVEHLRRVQQRALAELDQLFESVQARAFAGRL